MIESRTKFSPAVPRGGQAASLRRLALAFSVVIAGLGGGTAAAQAGPDSVEAINADYLRELDAVEKKRLARLEKLAGGVDASKAAELYITFFQTALSGGHYREAEPVAERLLKSERLDSRVHFLAQVTNILAELDRGDYDASLNSLADAMKTAREDGPDHQPVAMVLPRHTRLSILQTYYQKLVQADQFEVARKAFSLIAKNSTDPAIQDYAADRVARLERVGKPAPALEGKDLDGKPFRLAEQKGNPVLVVFWATWCLPCGPEAEMLDQIFANYRAKGMRVVAINVDNLQADAETPEEIAADVRRFVVEHNLHFTNLINGQGPEDYAKLFGVREIPANFLIDGAGNIEHVDLTPANIDEAIQKALAK